MHEKNLTRVGGDKIGQHEICNVSCKTYRFLISLLTDDSNRQNNPMLFVYVPVRDFVFVGAIQRIIFPLLP